MAKRPAFNLPSTDAAAAAPKTDWVYRSDAESPAREVSASGVIETPVSEADRIIARYSKYAAGIGVVPMPLIDLVVLGSIQLRMIGALCTYYELPFDRQLAKSVLASAAASIGATSFAYRTGRSLLKAIPVVGGIAAFAAMPLTSYTVTLALGKLFAAHFEKGGTLFDLFPDRVDAQLS